MTTSSRATSRMLRLLPLAALAAALAIGGLPRLRARAAAIRQATDFAEPTVAVTHPQTAPALRSISLPGDIQAFQEADIYARTSGYVARWYADIGTHVAAGAPLATLAAPELDAALAQARADEGSARANAGIAAITARRWSQLLVTRAVSAQQTEQFVSDDQAKQAALAAARANVERLAQLKSYEQVTAPFAGVVTQRNIDNGSLIDAGSASPKAMFHLAETDKLRVFVEVPQDDAQDIGPGTAARLTLPQDPGRVFAGTVTRTAGAIDPHSRTLRVEVDVDNPDGALLPGAYAQVQLLIRTARPGLSLPLNTLLFRPEGSLVATVDAAGKVKLVKVSLGRDFGQRIEIAAGLSAADRVILNPGDAIDAGEPVRIVAGKAG